MGEIIAENVIGVSIKVKFMGQIVRRNRSEDDYTRGGKRISYLPGKDVLLAHPLIDVLN